LIKVKGRFKVYLFHLVCFYQAYYTLVHYYSIADGGRIRFQILRSTGRPVATALY